MKHRVVLWLCLAICGAGAGLAQELDPHRVYEQKCSGCHAPHAGDFVWDSLTDTADGLAGRKSGRPLRDFLEQGHGRLSAPEIDALLEQFALIRQSGRLFRTKCRICHDSAVELARHDLILEDDRLTGRYSGRDIADFLNGHGRLTPSETEQMIEVLTRALQTRETGD